MERKWIQTEDFFIGNFGEPEATDEIIKSLPDNLEFNMGTMNSRENNDFRRCMVCAMDVRESNFIEEGLRNIIFNVNRNSWNFDITGWAGPIQFLKYIGKGHHITWHSDIKEYERRRILRPKPSIDNRKLSLVYCLSKESDYDGGEFEIEKSDGSIYSIKFDYGDFIIFPADRRHRVKPLKGGLRFAMAGWFT